MPCTLTADLVQKKGISRGIAQLWREWHIGITISTDPCEQTAAVRVLEVDKKDGNGGRRWRKQHVMRLVMNWRKPIYFALERRVKGHPLSSKTAAPGVSSESSNSGGTAGLTEKEAIEDLGVLARQVTQWCIGPCHRRPAISSSALLSTAQWFLFMKRMVFVCVASAVACD